MQFLRRCVGEANRFLGGFKFAEKGLGVNCNVRRPGRTVHKWADVSGLCGLLSSSSRLSCLLAILSRGLSKGMLPHKPSTPAARFLGLWEGRDGMLWRRIHAAYIAGEYIGSSKLQACERSHGKLTSSPRCPINL